MRQWVTDLMQVISVIIYEEAVTISIDYSV